MHYKLDMPIANLVNVVFIIQIQFMRVQKMSMSGGSGDFTTGN